MNKLKPNRLETKNTDEKPAFIPAFNRRFLTPLYDPMMKLLAREPTFKPRLVEQGRIEKGQRILDLGCGTATLTILIKKTQPHAEVIGLDADHEILKIAKTKVAETGLDIMLDYGTATKLPYSDRSFDRVYASMVFHHLTPKDKTWALREVFRVLKPGGELHVAELGKPHNPLMVVPSQVIGRLEEASDLVKGKLPLMLRDAGFEQVEETRRFMTLFGTFALYKAQRPLELCQPRPRFAHEELKPRTLDEERKYYSSVKKVFRVLAPFYDTGTVFISGLRDKAVDFTNAAESSRILDVATGTGKQAFAFAKKGHDVIGIDLSEDMLKVAKKKNRFEKVRFQVADATNLPFEGNSFDVSCVSFALHDMIPSVRETALKEMVRVAKPDGTIVIVDYALPRNRISRFLIYNFVKLYELYYSEFIKSDLEALLKKSGVEIKERLQVLLGVGRILKGRKIAGD